MNSYIFVFFICRPISGYYYVNKYCLLSRYIKCSPITDLTILSTVRRHRHTVRIVPIFVFVEYNNILIMIILSRPIRSNEMCQANHRVPQLHIQCAVSSKTHFHTLRNNTFETNNHKFEKYSIIFYPFCRSNLRPECTILRRFDQNFCVCVVVVKLYIDRWTGHTHNPARYSSTV